MVRLRVFSLWGGVLSVLGIARTRADGVELAIALKPVDAMTVTANYSYIDSENRSPGANLDKDLARRPRETANAEASYLWPVKLTTAVAVRYAGDSFDDHVRDTMVAGAGLNRQETVEFVIARARHAVDRLALFASGESGFLGCRFRPRALLGAPDPARCGRRPGGRPA